MPARFDIAARHVGGLSGWRAAIVTAAAYAVVGWLAVGLAGPPGYAAPLYPPAGIALAAVLVWGRTALPGVWLGAFAVNVGLGALRGQTGVALLALPAVIAFGAALQAGVGAALIRRFSHTPVVLNAPRDILASGLLGGALACVLSPSVATFTLLWAGAVPAEGWMSNWLTWWLGDTLGVLIAAPAVLTLIGQPRDEWRPRRLTLGLPLLLTLGLVAAGMTELARLEEQRRSATFERDADRLANEAQSRMQVPLYALEALHGLALAVPMMDDGALRAASRWWLALPMKLQAMGYSERVATSDLPAYERAVRAEHLPEYRVFQRDDGAALAGDGEVLALRLIEPQQENASALGVNALSVQTARAALMVARRSGEPSATGGFKLTQSRIDETGIVVYQALYAGPVRNEAERQARFRAVVFVTVRAEAMLADLADSANSYLQWCVVDPEPTSTRLRIAGPAGCDVSVAHEGFQTTRPLQLAGHRFELRMHAPSAAVPRSPREGALLLSLAALSAAAMLGALLLLITGNNRRTELAVQSGTAELRREMEERTQAQEALRESEARLRNILDHAPIGVMFVDTQGRLLECNPRLCEMLGQTPDQLRGRSFDEFAYPEALSTLPGRPLDKGPATEEARGSQRDMRLLRADGQTLWVQVTSTALRDAEGRVGRRVGVVQDITEHMRLEESERALQRAEASSRAKSEFVSRMSHELRTPLNAMIGFAQLLGLDREPGLVAHQREWTQQIQRAGWHLLEMINETLDLARIESGAVKLTLKPVALVPVLGAVQAMVSAAAAQRDVTVEESLANDAGAVVADITRLKQVMTNLLSNAVKYNRQGGTVQVSTRAVVGNLVEIAVTDSGLGMTEQQLSALFQPYNRLGRESSGIEGTGIGLVISRRLAELMGGTLEARSVAGQGSTFSLRLPAAAAAEWPDVTARHTAPAPYRQRSVHYVEDNPTNVEVMRGVLLQRPQIELGVSTNGLDGLEALRRHRPDLILLDMQLPDISGLELLRHLKQDDTLADIPVIVVSADATTARMQEALTLGAVHYVTKPLDVARFLALLDDALEVLDTRWGM